MKNINVILLYGATMTCVTDSDDVSFSEILDSIKKETDKYNVTFTDRTDITGGFRMQLEDIVRASSAVRKAAVDDGADGVVVVMGTNCLEEAAFGIELLTQDIDVPVVITGGMRTSDMISADGPGNLRDAICAAASDKLSGIGPVVVFNSWIMAAQYVRKTHPSNINAFSSEFSLGMVSEGDVSLRTVPVRKKLPWIKSEPTHKTDVLLFHCYLGVNEKLLNHIEEDGYEGLVVAGTGGGEIVSSVFGRLEELRNKYGMKFPIVIGSRIGTGEPLRKEYGYYVGSPSYILENYLQTGILDCYKARILLAMLLMSECSPEQIKDSFNLYICG